MKKIEKVSIADISFTLDDDAYVSLKQYLETLHVLYDRDPDGGEIIADIEARIAELILNEQVYTKVVTKRLIDSIIAQLGTPEEIGDDVFEPSPANVQNQDPTIPRRLYRSFEGKIFGGICSGMAQYWNVNVVWLRLLFLSPIIMFVLCLPFRWHIATEFRDFLMGCMWVFAVLYVVLWMAIPMAKTPRQRLEARGKKITPSTIRQNLQEGAKTPSTKKAASVFAEILAVLGRILLFFIKFVVAVVGFSFVIAAVAMLIGMFALPFIPGAMPSVSVFGWDLLSNADISTIPLMLFAELVLFCVMIPFFVVGMALLSLVFNWKLGRLFYWILLGVWFVAAISCTVLAAANARFLKDTLRGEVSKRGAVTEWLDKRNIDGDRREILMEFLEEEDNGANEISINITGDSIVVSSWRNQSADSTAVENGTELRRRIVIKSERKDRKKMKEANM